ncbi:hypothetical protein IE53DRAFT_36982 [Violaceomyces palustris]|uniref:Uncharacterized protein n=1 Tax=Violaceomyces palustris TaxID=1673888 RepID=A0ACD0P174_9BASI|nr:hypothetical protein IE53DRAFT_36982 [Violaceomyces palustris]
MVRERRSRQSQCERARARARKPRSSKDTRPHPPLDPRLARRSHYTQPIRLIFLLGQLHHSLSTTANLLRERETKKKESAVDSTQPPHGPPFYPNFSITLNRTLSLQPLHHRPSSLLASLPAKLTSIPFSPSPRPTTTPTLYHPPRPSPLEVSS